MLRENSTHQSLSQPMVSSMAQLSPNSFPPVSISLEPLQRLGQNPQNPPLGGNHDAFIRAERQAAVTSLGQQALSGMNLQDLFRITAEIIAQTLRLPYARLWQVLSDGSTLRQVAVVGALMPGRTVEVSSFTQPWVQSLLAVREPMLICRSCEGPCDPRLMPMLPRDDFNGIGLLIHNSVATLGLLEVYTPDPICFDLEAVQFLQNVVEMLAIAIERKQAESLLQTQSQILEQVASGTELCEVFTGLCLQLEEQAPGSMCSIMLLNESGTQMEAIAAPNMPEDWRSAMEEIKLLEEPVGACALALREGSAVISEDVAQDETWGRLQEFALVRGVRSLWATPFFSQAGDILGVFAIAHTVPCAPTMFHQQLIRAATHLATLASQSRHTEEQLKRQALYDPLTGLLNRTYFMTQLRQRLETPENLFAVLFLDVDHFKLVNDSLGHNAGDQLLIQMAQRLRPCIRKTDIFARLGGDEFSILLDGVKTVQQAQSIADQIKAVLSLPFQIEDRQVFASVSVGIAHSDNLYEHPEDILRDADIAMYQAKSQGRSQSATFDKTMHDTIMSRLQTETELRRVVEQLFLDGSSQLRLYYQPIISLTTGRIVGFEALIRWMHPERGIVSPMEFIPVAEETGLIVPIGQWIVQEACEQLQYWQHKLEMPELVVSVNVSGRQFVQSDFLPTIRQILSFTGLPPACLKLEITESVLMETAAKVMDRLEQLQEMGIQLSLDDFGTGYSSLSYLHRFPINTLKIDRSFINILTPEQDQVVKAIVALAHGLKMDAVAEGIETQEQLNQLRDLGCEFGQGFLFSPPVPSDQAEHLLLNQPKWIK
jgi:diguanylate cyclase (GGDEF)-like protein